MVKKQWYLLIAGICAFLLLVGLLGAYLYFYRTVNIDSADCAPEEGILLAYIDGEPCYYDPVYLFKLTDGAFPAEPSVTDKKKALFYELAYLESVGEGNGVSREALDRQTALRKVSVAGWNDSLREMEEDFEEIKNDGTFTAKSIAQQEKELIESRQYVERYYELWSACTEEAGITAAKYWRENQAFFKKGILVAAYTSEQVDEYLQKVENQEIEDNTDCFSDEFMLKDFDALVKKYQADIVDADLK